MQCVGYHNQFPQAITVYRLYAQGIFHNINYSTSCR